MRTLDRVARWLGGSVLVLAACAPLAPRAVAAGERLVVSLSEPFEIDGRVYPAGTLALESIRDLNPATSLDEVTVGGEPRGILMAHTRRGESGASRDSVVFVRSAEGRLALLGYVRGSSEPGRLYVFKTRGRKEPAIARGESAPLLSPR